MSIEFRCQSCSRILRTPDESAGKKARCPQCGAIVDIPLASTATDQPAGEHPPALSGDPFDKTPPPSAPFPSFPTASSGDVGAANPFAEKSAASPTGMPGAGGGAASPFAASSTTSNNPYAAPTLGSDWRDPTAGAAQGGELVHRRADMQDLLQTTWNMLTQQFGMAIVMGLVFMGINVGLRVLTYVFVQIGAATGKPAIMIAMLFVVIIIIFFGQVWLQFGLALTALRWGRTGQIQVGDYFAVGPYYLRGLGLTFLTILMIFGILLVLCLIPALIAVPFGEPAAIVIAAVIGALVAMPFVIYVALSVYLATYFVLDRNVGVVDALKMSNQFMAGNRMTMFVTGMVVGVVGGLAILVTCCFGSLAVVPFGGLLAAVAYLRITGQAIYQPLAASGPNSVKT